MTTFDLIVVGAGPAGSNAALEATSAGLRVALVEEQAGAGGQVWRMPEAGLSGLPDNPESRQGNALRSRLAASSVVLLTGRRVWSVTGGFRADMVGPNGTESVQAPRLVAATGAHERIVPFPGWTLPGVIGLAAATVLLKVQAVLPGRTVVVAGCGPLLPAVAAAIVKAGGHVAAVADLAGPGDWLAAVPALLRQPRLFGRGLGWMMRLGAARVPVLFHHGVRRVEGEGQVSRMALAPVNAEGAWVTGAERVLEAEALVVGHGLVPGAEVPRLMRAEMRFERHRGGWVPALDADGRTSVPGLYAAGDGVGLRGAAMAEIDGARAGLAAALDAGRLAAQAFRARTAVLQARARPAAAFSSAMAGLMALRPAQVAAIPKDTVICRCEDVTRAEIEIAAREGAAELNQLKDFTRCGMGPCQGRMCGDVAAELLSQSLGVRRAQVGTWTGRPPLRPMPLTDLLGQFSYDDIPIPEPAPL